MKRLDSTPMALYVALLLLSQPQYHPDYLMIDLSIQDINPEAIINSARNSQGKIKSPLIAYGFVELFSEVDIKEGLLFIDKDYNFLELKETLRKS
jgi:hypothetical protein